MELALATSAVRERHKRNGRATNLKIEWGGVYSELVRFTPRELIEELRSRGYKGKLYVTREIEL